MRIAAIQCRTNTGEIAEVPVAEILQVLSGGGTSLGTGLVPKSNGSQYIASGISVDDTGQIKFDGYGSERAFTGIATGLIGFTNDGRLITLPLQQTSSGAKVSAENQTTTTTVSTQGVLPFYTDAVGTLGDTDIINDNGNYSVGGQGTFWKWDVNAGSVNIDQRSTTTTGTTDGYRINGKLVLSFDPVSGELTIGNTTYKTTNIQYLKSHSVAFNTTPTGTVMAPGVEVWNDTYGTLELGLKGGNLTYRLGQSSMAYVKNADNAGLTKGTVVYPVGSDGSNKTVRLAQANAESTSSRTFGVIAETVTGGNKAFCITEGIIENINTSALTEGAAVYLSPSVAGGFTTTKPSAPNHMVLVGFCIRSHAVNGSIFVKVQNGFELNEIHDVAIGILANNNLLAYESSTSLWKNKTYADLGLFPAPSGLTTNYVTKWNGTALVNSMIVDNAANVTILGTALQFPTQLTVSESTHATSKRSVVSVGAYQFISDVYADSSRHFGLYNTNTSSVALTIFNNSNVGIGTTSPNYKLDVVTTSWNGMKITTVGSDRNNPALDLISGSVDMVVSPDNVSGKSWVGNYSNHGLSFHTNNIERVTILAGGNVAIGQASDNTLGRLQVNGNIWANGNFVTPFSFITSSTTPIACDHASNSDIWLRGGGALSVVNQPYNLYLFRILHNGNVGVNTANPTYRLDVTGTGHFTGAVLFDAVPSTPVAPTLGDHLVNLNYLNSVTFLKRGETVKTISLTNITLSGTQTVSGVAVVVGDIVLVAGQTTASQNGPYVVAAGAWTRSTLGDSDAEIRGAYHYITSGTYANQRYINTNTSVITVGTTAITYGIDFGAETDPVFTSWRDTSRTANTFWAAPNGSNGVATWRSLVAADVPSLDWSKITTGKPTTISGYGITVLASDIPTLNQNTTGSAATLTTTRNIAITGDVAWNVNFNGSANVTAVGTLATVNANIGTFNNVTVNAKGLVTAASNVSYLTTNQTITLSGDVTGSGTTSITATLANSGVTAGTYTKITVDAKGRATSGTTLSASDIPSLDWSKITTGKPTTISGYGITDGYTITESDARFVHLEGDETIFGIKSFANNIFVGSSTFGEEYYLVGSTGYAFAKVHHQYGIVLESDDSSYGVVNRFNGVNTLNSSQSGLLLGSSINIYDNASERLQVTGNIRYSGTLKPNNVQGTAGTWLKNNGTGNADAWSVITHSDISNLSSYTGFNDVYQAKDATLTALAGLDTNGGIITQIGTDTFAKRTISGTTNRISITNGNGVSGNPTIDISSSYVGQASITTLGTITTGVWNGGVIPILYGGTGSSTQNFVDLTTQQTNIAGNKTFTGITTLANSTRIGGAYGVRFNSAQTYNGKTNVNTYFNGDISVGVYSQMKLDASDFMFSKGNVKIGGAYSGAIGTIEWATEKLDIDGNIRLSGVIKPDNVAPTAGYFLKGVDADNMAWSQLTVDDISDIDSLYQPILPSGSIGQFLVKDSTGANNFMHLELEPQGLSYNKIAVGDSANYLAEYDNFEFREGRYVAIFKNTDPTKAFYMGMYGTSNNSFVTASGGSLVLKGDNGIYLDGFTGFGNRMLIVDGNGKIAETTIPTGGGGGGSTSLGSELIGFGSPTNTVTGVSRFKWIDNRVIKIDNAGSSNIEIGRKFGTDNYGLFVNNGDLELFSTANVNLTLGSTSQFKVGDKLRYYRSTNSIQLDSDYTSGEYLTIGNPVGDVFWINAINAKLSLSGTELALGSTEASYMTFQNCKINWDTNDCVNGWSSGGTPQEGDEVTLIFSGGEFKLKRKI